MMGPEAGSMDDDGKGDTVMGGGEERAVPGDPPRDGRDREGDGRHPQKKDFSIVGVYACHGTVSSPSHE